MRIKRAVFRFGINIFRLFGLEVHRRGLIRTSMKDVLVHLKELGFVPNVVIDVGVGFGTHDLYEVFPYAKHLLIEPLTEFKPYISHILRKYSDAEWICAAAGEKNGLTNININKKLTTSSILGGYNTNIIEKRVVPLIRIDTICKERNYVGPFLLKADVQGAELKVLEGASGILDQTEIIILEVSLYKIFADNPLFDDVIFFMKAKSFCLYDLFGGIHCPVDKKLLQFDAVFVKQNSKFRKHGL